MPHIKPEGSFVALITPFNNDGSVDIEGFRTLLNFHQENINFYFRMIQNQKLKGKTQRPYL